MNPSQKTVAAFVKALNASGEPASDIADACLTAGAVVLGKMNLPRENLDVIFMVMRQIAEGKLEPPRGVDPELMS